MDIEKCCECEHIFEEKCMWGTVYRDFDEYTCKQCMLKKINELSSDNPVLIHDPEYTMDWKCDIFKIGEKYYDINKITLDEYEALPDEGKVIVDRKKKERREKEDDKIRKERALDGKCKYYMDLGWDDVSARWQAGLDMRFYKE